MAPRQTTSRRTRRQPQAALADRSSTCRHDLGCSGCARHDGSPATFSLHVNRASSWPSLSVRSLYRLAMDQWITVANTARWPKCTGCAAGRSHRRQQHEGSRRRRRELCDPHRRCQGGDRSAAGARRPGASPLHRLQDPGTQLQVRSCTLCRWSSWSPVVDRVFTSSAWPPQSRRCSVAAIRSDAIGQSYSQLGGPPVCRHLVPFC